MYREKFFQPIGGIARAPPIVTSATSERACRRKRRECLSSSLGADRRCTALPRHLAVDRGR